MAEEIKSGLSVEQQKRIDLLNEFEKQTEPERNARNAAIDNFDKSWEENWIKLQGEIDQKRATRATELTAEGVPSDAQVSILQMEAAKLIEQHHVAKDVAAREIEGGLAKPMRWVDFLNEKSKENPEDPSFTSLIEEAEKSPDAGIEGLGGIPAKAVTLDNLTHVVDKDGIIKYQRGPFTVIRDVGSRLDVQKTDNKDIEAALKIAAQKFDLDKGLMLTGDAEFKKRTAEIAGRLGLPLQNQEPEVMMAWKKGAALNKDLARSVLPSVERGITGDLAPPKPLMELNGPVLLKADPLTIENAEKLAVTPDGEGVVSMQAERVLKANGVIRETPLDDLRVLARTDLSKTDGGFSENDKEKLARNELLDDNGNLTQEAKDVVIVRDDRVMRTRSIMGPATDKVFGKYQTSGEWVRSQSNESKVEVKQEAEIKKSAHEELEHAFDADDIPFPINQKTHEKDQNSQSKKIEPAGLDQYDFDMGR